MRGGCIEGWRRFEEFIFAGGCGLGRPGQQCGDLRFAHTLEGAHRFKCLIEKLQAVNARDDDGSWQVQSNSPLIGLIKERSGAAIINLSPESTRFLFEERMAPLLQEEINELFYDV